MPTPLRLSDSELDAVFAAARPLRPRDRAAFLNALAIELQGRENGPRFVGPRHCRRAAAISRSAVSGGIAPLDREQKAPRCH
jgi:hypothetical protein